MPDTGGIIVIMKNQPTGPAEGQRLAEVDLMALSGGQIAVALHVGGLPYRWKHLSVRELIDLAVEGIEKIGIDEVRRIDTESINLNTAIHRASRTPGADAPHQHEFQQIWSSHRRHQNAVDAAWNILHDGETLVVTRH